MYRVAIVGCGRMAGSIDDEVLDYPAVALPYSHAAAYAQTPGVSLVAACDIQPEALQRFQARWQVPQGYADYRAMIDEARPEILSVTTHATHHAEVVVYAAERGVRGIYCEKPMACSLAEAERMAGACRAHGVVFNIGTLRRYHPGYQRIRRMAEEGQLGEVMAAYYFGSGQLMHSHSHSIDTLSYLLGDPAPVAVSGQLHPETIQPEGMQLAKDPSVLHAHILYAGGREAFLLPARGMYEFQLVGKDGVAYAWNNGIDWALRLRRTDTRWTIHSPAPFPEWEQGSPTLACVADLIHALETGAPSSGRLEIALPTMEISMGLIESHRRGGVEVALPAPARDYYVPAR